MPGSDLDHRTARWNHSAASSRRLKDDHSSDLEQLEALKWQYSGRAQMLVAPNRSSSAMSNACLQLMHQLIAEVDKLQFGSILNRDVSLVTLHGVGDKARGILLKPLHNDWPDQVGQSGFDRWR